MCNHLSRKDKIIKRAFDIIGSAVLLGATAPILVPAIGIAAFETRSSGIFKQTRVGHNGEFFGLLKVRTMHQSNSPGTTVTLGNDPRITRSGVIIRRLKVDELPQLINVLRGEMSLVGPRPDVPGFADKLQGDDRRILTVRPGITGPAAVVYRHEEELLMTVEDPERYNYEIIWPNKVRINRYYVENYRFRNDLRHIVDTLGSLFSSSEVSIARPTRKVH